MTDYPIFEETFQTMSTYKKAARLAKIISYVKHKSGISKDQLLDAVAEFTGGEVSSRTLERDLKTIREEFSIDIIYESVTNGYHVEQRDQEAVYEFLKLIEFANVGHLLQEGTTDFSKLADIVHLDDSSIFQGIEQVKTIVAAIQQQHQLSFVHINYWNQTQKEYTMTPLQIREYLNRWYVVGVPEGATEIRTFGIDRIQQLQISGHTQVKRTDYEDQLGQFAKIVGLNFNEGAARPQKIRLQVFHKHLKYLQSLPLHRSQDIQYEKKAEYGTVTYVLIPNYEFKIQLLKMHSFVIVEEPQELREEIQHMLQEALANYK
ncbi:putative transcriptional regulator [Leeuwenhoekiella blandensis MED217]|uniref:Putative transcriptional regulator n=2 Tax=Leeuwenhoekiella TaxID=283735 RepID=A3XPT9_LEEBM|nr:putative transcriptional regulator [Leeuwenhoekiella blandensis MED217]